MPHKYIFTSYKLRQVKIWGLDFRPCILNHTKIMEFCQFNEIDAIGKFLVAQRDAQAIFPYMTTTGLDLSFVELHRILQL